MLLHPHARELAEQGRTRLDYAPDTALLRGDRCVVKTSKHDQSTIDWQFTTDDARMKLRQFYLVEIEDDLQFQSCSYTQSHSLSILCPRKQILVVFP